MSRGPVIALAAIVLLSACSSTIGTLAAAGAVSFPFMLDDQHRPADQLLLGRDRSYLEVCAGVGGRESKMLPEAKELWTYDRGSCRVTFTFESGRVSAVNFANGARACGRTLDRCLSNAY